MKNIKIIKNYIRSIYHKKIFQRDVNHRNYNEILKKFASKDGEALDLGSGPKPQNPFLASNVYGVDIRSYDINDMVLKAYLGIDVIPFSDNKFEYVTSFDLLEHIPRLVLNEGVVTYPFIQLMNEIWRVLKKGGYFFSFTPCFPEKKAFQDPTHVNIMTEDTIRLYFCSKGWARVYGFYGSFEMIEEGWFNGHYWAIIQKSKEEPVLDINMLQR